MAEHQYLQHLGVRQGGYRRNAAQKAEETRLCYELRMLGHGYREVAELASETLGWHVSASTAQRRVEREAMARVEPAAKAYLEMELDRLDRYLLATERIAYETRDPKEKLAAIDRALKIGERRAKLLGLDAPEKHEVEVTEVDRADQELAAIIREEKARRARDATRS